MSKKTGVIIAILIVAVVVLVGVVAYLEFFKKADLTGTHVPVETNANNLDKYLESAIIIQELPKNANMEINFGNVVYSINGQEVSQAENPDAEVVVNLPEAYIKKVGEIGLCQSMREARNAGDLSYETGLSESQFLLKYRSVVKYRECFGA